ncbi:MAG: DUF2491 family protein [Gammaproteobacteria bacterium]|nr:DUF2491 family protein [Gammaproteobacteria bacterium]
MFAFLAKALGTALRREEPKGPATPASEACLGLARGRMVAVDPLPFQFLAGRMLVVPPEGDQRIESRGLADLGAGCALHRYYVSDDAFIQIGTTNGLREDLKLFVFHETRNPGSLAEFQTWLGKTSQIGRSELDYGGYRYARVWGGDEVHAPPVLFEEAVYTDSDTLAAYTVRHHCMLYERTVEGAERQEYLLISAEQTGEDYCVVFSVGADLSSADLQIV